MTREEAIKHLSEWMDEKMWRCFGTIDREAISIAIEALSKPNHETDTEVRLAVTNRKKEKVILWDAFGELEYYPIKALSEPINCVKCKHYYETEDDTDVHGYCRMDTAHTDLISRADAIEAFGLSEKTRKYGGDHSGYDTMLKYEIQDVLENLPSADAEWIPVSERLPEVGEICLLTVHEYGWNCKDYTRVIIGEYSDNYADHILAWMPLPKPYREEAIKVLNTYDVNFNEYTAEEIADAIDMAIESLSADAVHIHNDGTLEVKTPNAQKVGRVLVIDTDSHIGGGLFYPDDAVPQSEQYKKGFEDAKRAFLVEYARERRNAQLEVMLNGTVLIPQHQWIEMERELAELKSKFESADAVKVVRCGCCKHMRADGYCYMFADDRIRPSVSDFCSYGERK